MEHTLYTPGGVAYRVKLDFESWGLFNWTGIDGMEMCGIFPEGRRPFEPLPVALCRQMWPMMAGTPIACQEAHVLCKCGQCSHFFPSLLVGRWVLRAACCPFCSTVYLRSIREWNLLPVTE